MEKTIKKHKFYCDGCGKKIGESTEDKDSGCYMTFGEIEFRFMGRKFTGCFCAECEERKIEEIFRKIRELGFEEGVRVDG